MATDTQLDALTDAQRSAQLRNAAVVAALVARYWRSTVKSKDLEATAAAWLKAMLPIIGAGHRQSVSIADAYYAAVRRLELPDAPRLVTPAAPTLNVEQVTESLRITSIVRVQQDLRRLDERPLKTNPTSPAEVDAAVRSGGDSAAQAAMRHVQNGGREAILATTQADPVALGYQRMTQAVPCYFCALLASRGPVYKEDSFAQSDLRFTGPGNIKVHDSCGCFYAPVFARRAPDGDQKRWDDLYRSSTTGASGPGALRAFRRAYEGRA